MSKISPLYDDIKLNITIVSDTHIDEKHPFPFMPKYYLKKSLSESEKSASPVDVFLTIGDTTSRGSEKNWSMAYDCFKKFTPAKKIILAIGNHDCWSDDGYESAESEYKKYFEKICGDKTEKMYFSYIINGYHLIFLGNEQDSGCEAQISDEQFEWFKSELKAGSDSGKPIFVFCHQSLNGKHGLPRTWDKHEKPDRDPKEGGIGAKSEIIEAEMKKYKNVFYFSGHSHMGFSGEEMKKKEGYSSIEDDDGVTLVNLPSLACGNHHGADNSMGMGIQLEAYTDRVILRLRNFDKSKWIESFIVKDGKPYWEQMLWW